MLSAVDLLTAGIVIAIVWAIATFLDSRAGKAFVGLALIGVLIEIVWSLLS